MSNVKLTSKEVGLVRAKILKDLKAFSFIWRKNKQTSKCTFKNNVKDFFKYVKSFAYSN